MRHRTGRARDLDVGGGELLAGLVDIGNADREMAEAWREKGFRAIAYNTDIGLLQDSLRGALVRLKG